MRVNLIHDVDNTLYILKFEQVSERQRKLVNRKWLLEVIHRKDDV